MTRRFSPQVIAELNSLPPVDLSNRPQVIGFTIDSDTSQDLDDAIWIEPNNQGAVISVHIADPTAMIPHQSAIDQAAIARVETLYHTKKVDPMFPPELANNKLSLLEGQIRPTITVQISLNNQVEIIDSNLFLSYISSLKKFAYAEVEEQIKQPESPFFQVLNYCEIWARKLNWKRTNYGAIGGTEVGGIYLSEEGKPIEIMQYRSQQIIQEFMIAANLAIASLAMEKQIPILYRNHTHKEIAPDQKTIIKVLSTLGMPDLIRAKLASWLNPAEYNPYLIEHFALALPYYTHFTSPIRRVADYINHRILKAVLIEKKKSPYNREELTKIAEYINQYKENHKEKTSEYFQNKRKQQAERALKIADQLQILSDKEFSNVIKNAAQTSKMPAVIPEAIKRLQANQLKPLDLYYLALAKYDDDPTTEEIKKALKAYFQNHETEATQILQITSQRDGKNIDYIQEQDENNSFAAWCIVDNLTTLNPALGKNKQETKHGASVLWWEKYLDDNLVTSEKRCQDWGKSEENHQEPSLFELEINEEELDWEYDDELEDMETAVDTEYQGLDFFPGSDNPISYLNNNLPILGMEKAKYQYSPIPNGWQCTCSVFYQGEVITGVKEGQRKKDAKTEAALSVLTKLHQLNVFASLPPNP